MYDFESPDNPFRGYERSAYVQESGYGKMAEVNLIALGLVGGVPALRQVGLNFQKARTVSLAVQGMGASVGAGSVIDSARQDKSYEEIGMSVEVGMVSAAYRYNVGSIGSGIYNKNISCVLEKPYNTTSVILGNALSAVSTEIMARTLLSDTERK